MTKLILLATTAALAAGASALTIPATHLTDAQANAMLINKTFGSESRIGDVSGGATFEQGIQRPTSGYFATADYGWTSGQVLPFSMIYNAISRQIDYQVGAQNITTVLAPSDIKGVTDLFFRLRAVLNDETAATVTLANLRLNGANIDGPWTNSTSTPDVYLVKGSDVTALTGSSLANGFTLTGDQTLSWMGTRPTNSNLAYQIKVAEAVPEPATIATLGLGLAAILRRRRSR